MGPLYINDTCSLPAEDLSFRAVRASGPGGQNVNKVSSKVELVFELERSAALGPEVKQRLRALAGGAVTHDGRLLLKSQLTRDQRRNLADALTRLRALVLLALERPARRVPTRTPARVARVRLAEKRRAKARRDDRRVAD